MVLVTTGGNAIPTFRLEMEFVELGILQGKRSSSCSSVMIIYVLSFAFSRLYHMTHTMFGDSLDNIASSELITLALTVPEFHPFMTRSDKFCL